MHSIYHDGYYVATAPTSFICCKVGLATKILHFLCLHNTFMTTVVTSNESIAVTNRKKKHLKFNY